MASQLDNPVWHALAGPHATIAFGQGGARHYPRDMAPFSAIVAPSADAYADLAIDLPPRLEARLFRPSEEPAPAGWKTVSARPIVQMVADRPGLPPTLGAEAEVVPLLSADNADMLVLADAARPGPFGPRTTMLGGYVGIRDAATGRLLAMAGERFLLHGYVELSAIAVHPDARGRGFGAALICCLARRALCRGVVPFLHVFPDNPAATLYTRLGFRVRATLWVLWHRQETGAPR